jgi:hypothetical protein
MKAIGIIFVLLALAIGVVPQFTNCSAQGRAIELPGGRTIPMKCHWTAMSAPAVAVPLLIVGGLMFFSRRRETLLALSLLGAVLGVFAILLPTYLIGGTDVFVPVGEEKIKLYGYSVALKAKMGPTGACGLQIPTMIRRGCYHRAESSFA